MQPLLDLDFRTSYVDAGVLYTPGTTGVLSSLVSRAVLGTGAPGNAAAPALTTVGAAFDGGDYLDTQALDVLEWYSPFSLVVRGRVVYDAGTQSLLSNRDAAEPYAIVTVTAGVLALEMASASSMLQLFSSATTSRTPCTWVITSDGSGLPSGCFVYENGRDISDTRAGSVDATINGANPYRIGANASGGLALLAGSSLRRVQIYPFAMTPSQVRVHHERLEREGKS